MKRTWINPISVTLLVCQATFIPTLRTPFLPIIFYSCMPRHRIPPLPSQEAISSLQTILLTSKSFQRRVPAQTTETETWPSRNSNIFQQQKFVQRRAKCQAHLRLEFCIRESLLHLGNETFEELFKANLSRVRNVQFRSIAYLTSRHERRGETQN